MPAREARYYRKLDDDWVQCTLCPFSCRIPPGSRGRCRVRENRGGVLYTLAYGGVSSINFNPVERGPFYHFYPGSRVLEIATPGCNLDCDFCLGWILSQANPEDVETIQLSPERIAESARESSCLGIMYTQTEPFVSIEFFEEVAERARNLGLKNLFVTNGYVNPEPLEDVIDLIDAMSITPKSSDPEFYRRYCKGLNWEPAFETARLARERGVHIEIAFVVIPGYTDGEQEIRALARRILEDLGEDTPLELLRFFPSYRMDNLSSTPERTLNRCREIAMEEGLRYVYVCNIYSNPGKNTYCPSCGELLIERIGYYTSQFRIIDGRCPSCGERIPVIYDENRAGGSPASC